MKNILLIIVLIVATATISLGQSASWNYRVNSGNLGINYSWIDCTDGTELKSSDLNRGNLDDGRWNINWPFNFKVYDNNYNTSKKLSISTNGFIRFDGNADYSNWAAARDYVLASSPSTDFGQILCYGISDVSFTSSNSRVYAKVTGAAPNRIFTIEFVQMGYYWAAGVYGDVQVSFYETSNNIVIKAGNNNVNYEGAEIGLHSGVSPYFHYWQDVDNASGNTWIEYIPSVATSYDITSYVRPPASQPSATAFPTSATTSGTAHSVLSFKITDTGGDGVPTKISKIRIKNAYPANRADWTDCIAGVVLNDGSRDLNLGVTTIDDNYIDFLFNIDEFDVPDGSTVNLTLKIYLNAGAAIEGKTMQFYIDDNNHGWFYDQMGSGLLSNFGNASDITSNVFTYSITATQLVFTVNPPDIIHQNNAISPVITVEAQDGVGNKDANFNGTVTLANSGGLSMTNSTAAIVNGVATFPNIQFSQTGGPITLTTSNAHGLTDGTSTETTVAILNVLFSDDFEDATQSQLDWAVSGTTNVWQVGDQTNDAWGPPSGHSANGVYGTYLNSGYNNNVSAYLESPIIDLAGSSDPKVKFWMDMESELEWDGGTVQIRVKPNASSPWGNYYTVSMSDAGYSGNIPNDTDVDALSNNADGWSGDSPSGEWAEVQIDLFNLTTSGLNGIDASSLIQLRFWFASDNNVTDAGWYIDDFEVSYTSFPGLWSTSAATNDWGAPSNWDDGIVPDGIFVTIPTGAANYPVIDETANASSLLIKDGGQLIVSTGGNLNLSASLTVGQGTSGSFEINDGSCILVGDLYTNSGSTTTISGGNIQFTNWAKSTTAEFAEGNINLTSGTITASGNVMFADANLNGTMTGDFTLNVAGNFSISDNVWAVPTGGTIILSATSPLSLEALNGNALTAYNLQLANTGGITLSSSANILNNLEVSETTLITVPPSVNLQVTGDFTLHASDKKSAALIDNENVIVGGVSTVEISTSANVFQYISSPVSAAPTTLFTKAPWGANNYNFYIYNEANTNANWAYGWVRPAAGTLAPAKGYAYYLTSPYIHKVNGGNFNTGNISIPVYNSGTNPSNSWNLIGNPYPSPLNADDFISANANVDPASGLLTGTIYFWDDDGSDGSDYASADYATYNLAGSVGGGSGKTSNGFISIGQAFFVQANNNGNVTFTNSMRSETQAVSFKSAPSAKAVNKNILLSVVNSSNDYNETLIAFIDDATNGYDNLYDGTKVIGNNNLALYSMLDNKPYAIQALSQIDANVDTLVIVPLGLKIGKAETCKIKINSIEKIDAGYDFYIKDNVIDTLYALDLDNYVSLTNTIGTYNERYSLILKSTPEIVIAEEETTPTDTTLTVDDGTAATDTIIIDDGTIITDSIETDDGIIVTDSIETDDNTIVTDSIETDDGTIITDSIGTDDGTIVTDSIETDDGTIVTDSIETDDGTIVTDSIETDDGTIVTDSIETDDGTIVTDSIATDDGNIYTDSTTVDDGTINTDSNSTLDENQEITIKNSLVRVFSARNSLFIELSNPPATNATSLTIFDIRGGKILEISVQLSKKNEIPLGLSPGIYIVRIYNPELIPITQKIVIGQ